MQEGSPPHGVARDFVPTQTAANAIAASASEDSAIATDRDRLRVAVLLLAFNEAAGIAAVIAAFRAALPQARPYVHANNSTDAAIAEAKRAGALVRSAAGQWPCRSAHVCRC